jgi:hypothetical protein
MTESLVYPRWSLALVTTAHALLFAWAACVLPWRGGTLFAVLTALLAAMHAATAVLAAVRSRFLAPAWRILALLSLAYLVKIGWDVITSAVYIATVYEGMGKGIAIALAAGVGLVALFTVPIACWGLACTGGARLRRVGIAALGAIAVLLLAAALGSSRGRSEPLAGVGDTAEQSKAILAAALPAASELTLPSATAPTSSLLTLSPVSCALPPLQAESTVVLVFVDRQGAVASRCVQASRDRIAQAVRDLFATEATRSPLAVDVFIAAHPLHPSGSLLGPIADNLVARPGLDGLCIAERCLTPWQLLALGVFDDAAPVPHFDKLLMGFNAARVQELLGGVPAQTVEGLVRIQTQSFSVDGRGHWHRLRRGREVDVDVGTESVDRAVASAEQFMVRAQLPSGDFRYTMNRYSGVEEAVNPSLPRHAGAVLALCEVGRSAEAQAAIERGLAAMARFEIRKGDISALVREADQSEADLGSSAIGLAALLACRDRVGPGYDPLIGRLARLLLWLETEAGGFSPGIDRHTGEKLPGPTPLYAGGQAIYALSLLEKLAGEVPADTRALFPAQSELTRAVDRAMTYVAEQYWNHSMRDFLFGYEHWHCIAARASLSHHRHLGYEQFCLDFVSFATRLFLDADDEVSPEFIGGWGFGNIIPPHNGSTGVVGEALAGAIAIKRARGLDVTRELELVRAMLGFFLRQQWNEVNCFACNRPQITYGGFSGYMTSPLGRIDDTEHIWSAMSQGARLLGWVGVGG